MDSIGLYLTTALLALFASTTHGVTHSRSYMGCYKDSLPRVFPDYYENPGNTIEECFQKAVQLGYEMFAIQNGGECWLDDEKRNNFDKYGKSKECLGKYGGKWANSVYRIKSFCTRKTQEGHCCVFPFTYKGKKYFTCTTKSHNREWCSTTKNYDKDGDWGNCVDPCEKGWRYFNNRCYKVVSNRMTWKEARTTCNSLGSDLVVIHSGTENHFVGSMLPKIFNVWIGYYRKEDQKFYWVDNSKPTYTNWDRNEPNDAGAGEDCAEMRRNSFLWNDLSCTKHKKAAVCEKGI